MKQKTQVIILLVLVVIGASILAVEYWPSGGGKSGTASLFQAYQRLNFPNPEIQWQRIDLRRKADYKATGVNLFSMVVPPSPADVKADEDRRKADADRHKNDPPPPPPPAQLPIRMTFLSSAKAIRSSEDFAF